MSGEETWGLCREARDKVARQVKLEPGYYMEWGGQFENLERASARLLLVVPLTLALIFLLLYFAFKSLRLALIIFLNVPFAVTGGVFALALRGMPFSISAAVGFIALFGVAVLNGVVLLSRTRAIESSGRPAHEAAYEGAQVRFPPRDPDGAGGQPGVHSHGLFPRHGGRGAEALGDGGDRRVNDLDPFNVVGSTLDLRVVS